MQGAWSWLAKKLAIPHRKSFIKKDRLSACLPSRKPLSPSALLSARPWKLDFSSLSASPAHFGQGALWACHGRVSSVRCAPPACLSPWLFVQGLVINESSPREHVPVAAGPAPRCSRASSVKQKGAGQRAPGGDSWPCSWWPNAHSHGCSFPGSLTLLLPCCYHKQSLLPQLPARRGHGMAAVHPRRLQEAVWGLSASLQIPAARWLEPLQRPASAPRRGTARRCDTRSKSHLPASQPQESQSHCCPGLSAPQRSWKK